MVLVIDCRMLILPKLFCCLADSTNTNLLHGFETYDNMLVQVRGSIMRNIEGPDLAYTHGDHNHELQKTIHPLTSTPKVCNMKVIVHEHGVALQDNRRRGK